MVVMAVLCFIRVAYPYDNNIFHRSIRYLLSDVTPTIARLLRLSWQGHRSSTCIQPHVSARVPPISCSVLFAQFQLIITKPEKFESLFMLFRILSSEESRIIRLFMILLDVGLCH